MHVLYLMNKDGARPFFTFRSSSGRFPDPAREKARSPVACRGAEVCRFERDAAERHHAGNRLDATAGNPSFCLIYAIFGLY